jgi:hypothetical protein
MRVGPNVFVGQVKIAVTGTAVQLPQNLCLVGITIINRGANAIFLGAAGVTNTSAGAGNAYEIPSAGQVVMCIDDTSKLYINGTANDYITFIGT